MGYILGNVWYDFNVVECEPKKQKKHLILKRANIWSASVIKEVLDIL